MGRAFALPTEESTTLALRTQQILAHETGVTRTVDPLGGSYFVEALTDAMEEKIGGIMADLEARGGMVRCIEDGYVQRLIADESAAVQRKVDRGERVIVGVNQYESDQPAPTLQPPRWTRWAGSSSSTAWPRCAAPATAAPRWTRSPACARPRSATPT